MHAPSPQQAQAQAPMPQAPPPMAVPQQDSWAMQMEAAQASAVPPTVRGRAALLERHQNTQCGVSQEPCGCTWQLDDCIARCRGEVQAIAEQCRQRGQKYFDRDFPADARALFINGQSPSTLRQGGMPSSWGRASEGAFSKARSPSKGLASRMTGNLTFMPGPMGGTYLLSCLAAMQTIGLDPKELIVWREPSVGLYGVRLFKDGEWIYEILDDFLPMDSHNQPACSKAACGGEVEDWLALLEKAYAKIHGSYEAIAFGSEAEALEDILGMGSNKINMSEFPIWGELWQHLRSKRRRGYVMVATDYGSTSVPGKAQNSGLLSGFGYPLGRLEMLDGEMLVELENPWPSGTWNGKWGERSNEMRGASQHASRILEPTYEGSRSFWMSIQDFCKHFTDVVEARSVSPYWQSAVVTSSTDRPSHPVISVSAPTQALFILSQPDRRWGNQEEYNNSIGLRIYRCRIIAAPAGSMGMKQNVSSPFKNLELLASRDLTRAHSAIVEVGKLEPNCLYIAVIDSEYKTTQLRLKVVASGLNPSRFRELSAPETQYLLQAQATAPHVENCDSFSSNGSADQMGQHRGHPSPYDHSPQQRDQPQFQPDSGWQEWHEQQEYDNGKGSINFQKMIQACMATCGANFRW